MRFWRQTLSCQLVTHNVEIQYRELTKECKNLVSTWPPVPRADLPASWRQTPYLLPCSWITCKFQWGPCFPPIYWICKKCQIHLFPTLAYLLKKLSYFWNSLSICEGVSGLSNPRKWCVPGWHTSGERLTRSTIWFLGGTKNDHCWGSARSNLCDDGTPTWVTSDWLCLWMWAAPSPTTYSSSGQGHLPSQYAFSCGSSILKGFRTSLPKTYYFGMGIILSCRQ